MDKMFLGIKGHVVCLNKQTGKELWRTKLKTDWGKPTMVVYSENVFAYVAGILFCLNDETGEVIWKNELSGLGHGSCVIALTGQSVDDQQQTASQSALAEVIDTAIDIST